MENKTVGLRNEEKVRRMMDSRKKGKMKRDREVERDGNG